AGVAGLIAAEVEVAADVEVRGVVQLLYAHFAAESHRVAAFDDSGDVSEVLRIIANPVVEECRTTGLIGSRIRRRNGIAVAWKTDQRQAEVLRCVRVQSERADGNAARKVSVLDVGTREAGVEVIDESRRCSPVVLQARV